MRPAPEQGFSLIEVLISLVVLTLAMGAVFGLMVENAQINKSQRMAADAQANARTCLSMVVQKLRRAGWDPEGGGIPTLALDPDLTDDVSQIEIFADLDGDMVTNSDDEQILIRHINGQIEWRRRATAAFNVLAPNISNDADGDGTAEPMFIPVPNPDPTRIRVQITARSPAPDPVTGEFIRYTVRSDVVLRKSL